MNLIQQMMASQRLVGGIVYDAVFAGDWSIMSRFEPKHCAPIFPVPDRIVAYHYVRRGRLIVCLPGADPLIADAGSMVLFPRNDAHVICSSPEVPATPAEQVFTSDGKQGPNIVRIAGDGPECALYCGWLGVDDQEQALIAALPSVITARCDVGARGAFLSSSLRYAAEELSGNATMVARLSQLFFEEAVSRYIESLPPEEEERVAALRDPAVGRALKLLHDPGQELLTLTSLAREAGVSRTVLVERFVRIFGEPPMRYRLRWQMRRAAQQLCDGGRIADIAYDSGFSSEAAFTRAFKRHYGLPPAAWRASQQSPQKPAELVS